MKYLFPFDRVPRDARVVIYGAGHVGQEYDFWLGQTGHAELVAFVDRDAAHVPEFDVPVFLPEKLPSLSYDVLVLAIEDRAVAQRVIRMLEEEYGVPAQKIIYDLRVLPAVTRKLYRYQEPDRSYAFARADALPFAIHIGGGFGDMIVGKRLLEEVFRWSDAVLLDVFVTPGKENFLRSLLDGQLQVNMVASEVSYPRKERDRYAAEFTFSIDLRLDAYNEEMLRRYPSVYAILQAIVKEKQAYGYLGDGQDSPLQYLRCQKDGLWRYTAYNRYTGFEVKDYHTEIPGTCVPPLEDGWTQKPYITINYGWDQEKGTAPQAKVWPKAENEAFIRRFHKAYPDIRVVQVGGKNFPPLQGCDAYALGRPFGEVQWILSHSLLHIDCEGGLVHLATQLGTKCVVLFGPTPMDFYGYPDNINLQAGPCQNCYYYIQDYTRCYRGLTPAPCMMAITPEMVMERVRQYLQKRSSS